MSGKEALLRRLSFFSKGTDVDLLRALFLSLFLCPSAGLHLRAPQGSGLCTPLPQAGQAKCGNVGAKDGLSGKDPGSGALGSVDCGALLLKRQVL